MACRLQRHRFWAAGVNDIWAVDQHDKWLRFGLALHTGIEPFSGKILWIHVWHSNHNPQLILSYYLDVVDELGCERILTKSSMTYLHILSQSFLLCLRVILARKILALQMPRQCCASGMTLH